MRWHWPMPAVIALTAVAAVTDAPAQDWLVLETDRFTLVSELNERDTLEWGEEFGVFVDSLRRLLPLNQNLLPPLTAVLFRRSGGFAPYRLRTESGLVGGTSGVFINYGTWSVIGMPGVRGGSSDHSTTYHEAVHWFMSADPARQPLWFSEGIAEVFSTFEITGGNAVWGRVIGNHLDFLRATGLQPMGEFLAVSQDEAMHVNATYYSQAWLFVHYLLFGRPNDGPALLGRFLQASRDQPPVEAFRAAFGIEPAAMDDQLRSYLRQDRFNNGRAPVDAAIGQSFELAPAPPAVVEASLARLALGTGNYELFEQHVASLRRLAPDDPTAFELTAVRQMQTGDPDVESLLDEAIARGSTDAQVWELKAVSLLRTLRSNEPLLSPTALAPADARRIADHLGRSILLRPLNRGAYRLLADVLFSVDEVVSADSETLAIGAIAYPVEGMVPLGQAAIAIRAGDFDTARRLVTLALTDAYELSNVQRAAARSLAGRLGLQTAATDED